MNGTLYNPNDLYSVPKLFQPRPMPFSQGSRRELQSTPFSQGSRRELQSPQDLQGLPKPQMLEVLVDCLPEWLYLGLKHFGGYIFFIFVLIMFVVVAGTIVFR
jgi:hypothetical protein